MFCAGHDSGCVGHDISGCAGRDGGCAGHDSGPSGGKRKPRVGIVKALSPSLSKDGDSIAIFTRYSVSSQQRVNLVKIDRLISSHCIDRHAP